ncbi:MAG TPA: hypothetical protein VFS93_04710 [Terrimesophilobacter sp.]|nr:hypothetical protein [Terrimesophilobacter sp.]
MRHRRTTAAVASLAVIGAVAILTGCAQGAGLITQTSESGHVLLAQERAVGAYPDAGVEGTFVLVGDTCFGLTREGATFTTVFPPGTSIVEGTEQISIPGWGTLSLGDEFTGGGGYYTQDSASYSDQVPAECRTDELVAVNPFR